MLFHALSAGAVFILVNRVLRHAGFAAVAGAAFLLNPLQPEVVLWVSGLQDGMWVCLALWAAVVYTGGAATAWRMTLTLALTSAALLSKETAVCFIGLFAVLEPFRRERPRPAVLLACYGLFAAQVVAYLLIRTQFAVNADAQLLVSPTPYFVKQFLTMPYRVFAFPWNGALPEPPLLFRCLLALGLLTLLARSARRPALPLALAALIIVFTVAPLGGYFYVGPDLTAARYLYGAAAGWALMLALFVGRSSTALVVQMSLAAALLAGSTVALRHNLQPWHTAAGLKAAIDAALAGGVPPARVVADWQRRTGISPELNAQGVPNQIQGVYFFQNGYPEYLQLRGAQ
jgi:hypothetical protein